MVVANNVNAAPEVSQVTIDKWEKIPTSGPLINWHNMVPVTKKAPDIKTCLAP